MASTALPEICSCPQMEQARATKAADPSRKSMQMTRHACAKQNSTVQTVHLLRTARLGSRSRAKPNEIAEGSKCASGCLNERPCEVVVGVRERCMPCHLPIDLRDGSAASLARALLHLRARADFRQRRRGHHHGSAAREGPTAADPKCGRR